MKRVIIALAGNPNSGKTTVFNQLTGARQHIGNYPGVTVEKKEGFFKYKGIEFQIIDLPGTYSLTPYTTDERVARRFLIEEKPDVVINVIDSSNLERNLYLTTQLMELDLPLVLAFNMHDTARKEGQVLDKERLAELLGYPIVFTVATKSKGMEELLETVVKVAGKERVAPLPAVIHGEEVEKIIERLTALISRVDTLKKKYVPRWVAIKLLEQDSEIIEDVKRQEGSQEILDELSQGMHHLEDIFADQACSLVADGRYGFISGACSEALRQTIEDRHSLSDLIDKVIIHKVVGLPIFFGLMWLLFKFTFTFSRPLMRLIEWVQVQLTTGVEALLPAGSALKSFVVDGVIAGVGSVLVFVPIIFLLFFAMGFLEYSGYLARAAFLMDRFMHKIGLHGRSFIPMLLGFGCNVPAIMATRTIEDERDRKVTILINSFMSCGARLPIYVLIIGAFFPPAMRGNILFSVYVLGIIAAVLTAKVFRRYVFRGESTSFVMELPPYRLPTLKGLLIHMWEKGVIYIKKAGTIIFAACVFVWFLSNFPWNPPYSRDYSQLIDQAKGNAKLVRQLEDAKEKEKFEKSYASSIGRAITPAFKPLGFAHWKVSVALVGGFAAKEIVIGTLGTLYAADDAGKKSDSLQQRLRKAKKQDGEKLFTPLSAYALMVFILLYVPCAATLAAIRMETHSWGWMFFAAFYTTAVAWIAAFIVYQGGRLIGLG